MHCLAEEGGAIVGKESVLSKNRGGIGRVAKAGGKGSSRLNVIYGHDIAVTHLIKGDFAVGFRTVIEL